MTEPVHVDLVKFALQKASELTRADNVRTDLRIFTKGKTIYFVAGGQLLAALRCSQEDKKAFFPFDTGLICLN